MHDTCDEHNWEETAKRYAISNSCRQEGRSYQDEVCEEIFSCPMGPSIEMMGVTAGSNTNDPPPLECWPGSGLNDYAGCWDSLSNSTVLIGAYATEAGRTDTEGGFFILHVIHFETNFIGKKV